MQQEKALKKIRILEVSKTKTFEDNSLLMEIAESQAKKFILKLLIIS